MSRRRSAERTAEPVGVGTSASPARPNDEFPSAVGTFKERVSYLDYDVESSGVHKSGLSGWINAAWLCMATFAVGKPLSNYLETGAVYNVQLLERAFEAIEKPIIPLISCIGFSFTAWILQVCVHRFNLSDQIASAIQHSTQSLMFVIAFPMAYVNNWPFTQSLWFSMEVMVIFMKMHSYNSTNRALREAYLSKKVAKNGKVETDDLSFSNYPNNLTLWNFIDYLLVPVLVYETNYPRLKNRRYSYILSQIVAAFFCIYTMFIVTTEFIRPVLKDTFDIIQFPGAILKLMLPCFCFFLLTFYLVFHVICNAFAEITLFADREFYADWWNATGYDEWSRKWNKPVHKFLYRHVYLRTKQKFKLSQHVASWLTFIFSAFLHELLFWSVLKAWTPWLFGFMMLQLPLIIVMKPCKGYRFANMVFWFGMLLGLPWIAVLYSSAYCKRFGC